MTKHHLDTFQMLLAAIINFANARGREDIVAACEDLAKDIVELLPADPQAAD